MRFHAFSTIALLSATLVFARPISDTSQQETKAAISTTDDSASPQSQPTDIGAPLLAVTSPHSSSVLDSGYPGGVDPPPGHKPETGLPPTDILALDIELPDYNQHCHSHRRHCGHRGHHQRHKHHRHTKYAMLDEYLDSCKVAKDILKGHIYPHAKDLAYVIDLARAFRNEHGEKTVLALEEYGTSEGGDHDHHSGSPDEGLKKTRYKKITALGLQRRDVTTDEGELIRRDTSS